MKESLNSRFESISPSAKSLLLTKALTNIPFAKEAADLIWGVRSIKTTQDKISSLGFLMRVLHFEKRYLSIDKALFETGIKNIIEFSSGYSFRGLSICEDPGVFYIDTDLPEIIESKKEILLELTNFCDYPTDNLFLQVLNILDRSAFTELIDHFPTSPVVMINEGLLVYLDEDQKRRLCSIIHDILRDKGGYWITADIYVERETQDSIINGFYDEKGRRFIVEHQVYENTFEDFEDAANFFKDCGFSIYRKIDIHSSQLSSRKFLAHLPQDKLDELKSLKTNRETWILKPK